MSSTTEGKIHAKLNLTYVFLLISSGSIDICELALKTRAQGSMKLVMLSSDNFWGPFPWQHIMWTFKKYFFELYYTHMSLENTLGIFCVCSTFFLAGS